MFHHKEQLPAQFNKLEDLIPYRNSLTELWAQEHFQPVLKFLSSLYKQNIDTLLYTNPVGDSLDLVRVAQRTEVAKLCNMLFNLPEVLLNLEGEFEKQKQKREQFTRAQEVGHIVEEGLPERPATTQEVQSWKERMKEKLR